MSRRFIVVAVVMPLVAIALGIVRAELTFARTRDFTFEINGYDPRDLLRGRYLRFRLQLQPANDRCPTASASCCFCLTQGPDAELVRVERSDCSEAKRCDGWLEPESARRGFRFYVTDTRAAELERQLMDAVVRRAAHARMAVDGNGRAHVRMLLIDGRPITGQADPPTP